MKPDYMERTAKIIEEILIQTCIDKLDTKVIEDILKDELNEYCSMLDGHYAEEYYNVISIAYDEGHSEGYDEGHSGGYYEGHSEGYDEGYSDGYDGGYSDGCDAGYDEGYAAGKSSLEGDVDNAYDEGYALGYSEGYSEVENE